MLINQEVKQEGDPYIPSIVLSHALSCSPVLSREFSVIIIRSLAFHVISKYPFVFIAIRY